jgi:hypothetical protein
MNIQQTSMPMQPYLYSAYLAKAERFLLGERSLMEAAESTVELAPGSHFMHPAPVFEIDDLNRITGFGAGTNRDYESGHTIATWREHTATRAHRMKNLLLIDGSLYAKRFKHSVSINNGPPLSFGMAPRLEHGVLAQSWLGARYFGHWLLEDVMLGLLASGRGDAIGVARQLTAQQSDYARFFNYRHKDLSNVAWVEDIEILSDSGLNPFHMDRLKALRKRFTGKSLFPRHPGVFLMRGSGGEARCLVNEAAVADFMRKCGFKVLNPGNESMETVRAAVANADLVVGVEGSQLSHGILGAAPGGAMLVLQPPFRFNNAFKERCDLLGITYAFIVGHAAEGGFTVDLNALARLIDRVQKQTQVY